MTTFGNPLPPLKEDATPHADDVYGVESRCKARAPEDVRDDWGNPIAGYPCLRGEGHTGNHEASDGANGWVSWPS